MIEIPIGTQVDVSPDGEVVLTDFRGVVVGIRDNWIQVRDQEDCVFDCDPAQITEVVDD